MGVRVLTTVFLLLGLMLLLSWPWFVGSQPPAAAPNAERLAHAWRFAIYFGALLLVFLMTAIFAWLTVRKQRRDYREQAMQNMQSLIEGTLRDHEQKAKPDDN